MDIILLVFFFVLGAIAASFAGVVAERLNTGRSFLSGRSSCNACGTFLSPLDLVPIISWIFSRGKCRTCGSRIGALYPLLEAVFGIIFVLAYLKLGLVFPLLVLLAALSLLLVIVLYDLRHTVVPESLSYGLLAFALVFAWSAASSSSEFGAALVAGGSLGLIFYLLYMLSKGRAMGLGDAPIALALSILVGPAVFSGLIFSFWIGAVIGIILLFFRRGGPRMGVEVPFVPFMAAGYVLAYFTGWNPFLLF